MPKDKDLFERLKEYVALTEAGLSIAGYMHRSVNKEYQRGYTNGVSQCIKEFYTSFPELRPKKRR